MEGYGAFVVRHEDDLMLAQPDRGDAPRQVLQVQSSNHNPLQSSRIIHHGDCRRHNGLARSPGDDNTLQKGLAGRRHHLEVTPVGNVRTGRLGRSPQARSHGTDAIAIQVEHRNAIELGQEGGKARQVGVRLVGVHRPQDGVPAEGPGHGKGIVDAGIDQGGDSLAGAQLAIQDLLT